MFHIVGIKLVNGSDDKVTDEILHKKAGDAVQDQGHHQAHPDKDQELETNDLKNFAPAGTYRKHGVQFILPEPEGQGNSQPKDQKGGKSNQNKNGIKDLFDSEYILQKVLNNHRGHHNLILHFTGLKSASQKGG